MLQPVPGPDPRPKSPADLVSGTIGLIIQARMGSSRLPGKSLLQAGGKPMLAYLLETLAHSALGPVVVVTSETPADDGIAVLADSMGLACVRGSESDVSSRFATAIRRFGFESFVRVCGDSPLMDAEMIRRAIAEFAEEPCDIATNTQPRSFPKGQSVEVIRSRSFLAALPEFDEPGDREHVTRWFYRNPRRVRIRNFASGGDWGAVQHSVDTPEDFHRFQRLLAAAQQPHWRCRWSDWVAMDTNPNGGGSGPG
ncbi:MAG: NTP transferase domain-containing protein [Fibrobacteria bacterium]